MIDIAELGDSEGVRLAEYYWVVILASNGGAMQRLP